MKCPFCSAENSRVIDSRASDDDLSIRRRRVCDACNKRFTTYEKIEFSQVMVVKKDNNREVFDREKLESGIRRSCHKRPVSAEKIKQTVDLIENEIYTRGVKEIATSEIGELVMDALKDLDTVAYVRFASVYREFKDVNTFVDEIKKILEKEDK